MASPVLAVTWPRESEPLRDGQRLLPFGPVGAFVVKARSLGSPRRACNRGTVLDHKGGEDGGR